MDDEDHLRAACWNLLWALNQRETHPVLDDRLAVKVGEVKKKNYQVLCPNCEATIIKENGQICDGVAWRVCVPNEKINDWMREVDYATYCPKCKNFKVLETDEPCNECLTECAREGTVKPLKFEEARVKVK